MSRRRCPRPTRSPLATTKAVSSTVPQHTCKCVFSATQPTASCNGRRRGRRRQAAHRLNVFVLRHGRWARRRRRRRRALVPVEEGADERRRAWRASEQTSEGTCCAQQSLLVLPGTPRSALAKQQLKRAHRGTHPGAASWAHSASHCRPAAAMPPALPHSAAGWTRRRYARRPGGPSQRQAYACAIWPWQRQPWRLHGQARCSTATAGRG